MKNIFRILAACFAVLVSANLANADLIWSEDFSSYADGAPVNGLATSGGTGTFVTNGTVAVNAAGQLVLTADAGRETLQIDTSIAGIDCGYFTFDLQRIVAPDPATSNSVFLQMTEGGRSTGGSPIPGFADTINGAQVSSVETINYYFNSSAAAYTYTAPDGSTESVAPGTYDYWRGTILAGDDQGAPDNDTNDAGTPGTVTSLVFNTFNQQEGNVYTFDNMSFNSIVHTGPSVLLGDVDLSGAVEFLDIAPFIAVLSSGVFQAEADCDENGTVEFLDIAPFIAILAGS